MSSSFLRRKERNAIPPVNDDRSSRAGSESGGAPIPARYTRGNDKGDVYSRGQRNLDNDRAELFGGYDPATQRGPNRFRDEVPGRSPNFNPDEPQADNEDDDVEAIKTQTRFVKQESVNSTRNALRIAREAEETARNTLLKLGDQSEKIASTERHLDVSKGHSLRAEDKTDELKQLNRSIFRPVITFNKDAKRRAQEQKVQARYEADKDHRERSMADIRDTQNRVGGALAAGRGGGGGEEDDDGIMSNGNARSRFRTAEQDTARKANWKRYQFEGTASDDEMENELDENLDEIGEAAARLKNLGLAMNQELDGQIDRLGRIDTKVGKLDQRIYSNTEKLKRIK